MGLTKSTTINDMNSHQVVDVVEPFSPGTWEEYDVLEDGRVKFLQKQRYHTPGDKPNFTPLVPWIGTEFLF